MATPVRIEKMPKRQKHSLEKKMSYYGYIFTAPIILGFLLMYIPVIIQSVIYSFSKISYIAGAGMSTEFIGWGNYQEVIQADDGKFVSTVISSTLGLLPNILVVLIFAFFIETVLNQNFKGRTPARVIFFIPVIMSSGVIAYFDNRQSMVDTYTSQGKLDVSASSNFDYSTLRSVVSGALNNETLSNIVLNAVDGIYSVITSSGVQFLVFLSGLQSISVNMYEAAKVEGATGWETFWKISFPMISPLILVNLLYTVIDLFLKKDNEAITLIDTALQTASQYAQASAMSWIYTLIILAFVGLSFLIVQKFIVYQD